MTTSSDIYVDHSLRTSMFFAQSRLFVAGNPKAAGTSLRWWLLPIHGVDVAGLTADSLWGESAPYQTVWDNEVDLRYTWKDLSATARQDALAAQDVLTVQPIRHPVSRAFSAWAGKYLVLEPAYHQRLPPGFDDPPLHIDSADQITDLFERFVRSLANQTSGDSGWADFDVHFWPQARLLKRVPQGAALLLRQESMAAGLDAIINHLNKHGITAPPMPRINENVVSYDSNLISDEALKFVVQLYGEDFAAFGYQNSAPDSRLHEVDLEWLNDVRGRNRRFGVVHRAATQERQRAQSLSAELAASHQQLRMAQLHEQELRSSRSWRITRPLRWMSDRMSRLRGRRGEDS